MRLDHSPSGGDGYPCASSLLDVEVVHESDEVVVLLRGELDRAGTPTLSACLEEIVDVVLRHPALVVNLAGFVATPPDAPGGDDGPAAP